MFLETFFVAALAALIGLAMCFAGYRFFKILIAIWGFFAGFNIGASGIAALFGTGFLATGTSWVVGFIFGVILGLLAYFFYYAAIIILGATFGWQLGAGFMEWLGFADNGFFAWVAGLLVGAVVAVLLLVFNAPKLFLIVLGALAGAAALIAGVLILFGQIPIQALGYGAVSAVLHNSWFWWLAWIVLAVIGIFVQIQLSRNYTVTREVYTY